MLSPGYVPDTCQKNNIVTLLVISMLCYRNIKCLLGYCVLDYHFEFCYFEFIYVNSYPKNR